jgi:predicted RNase H-like HicB family nuclease
MKIRALIEWDNETNSYSATCPELNFISSCGDSKEEAVINLKEAISLMLEPIPDQMIQNSKCLEEVDFAI